VESDQLKLGTHHQSTTTVRFPTCLNAQQRTYQT